MLRKLNHLAWLYTTCLLVILFSSGCQTPKPTSSLIDVNITVDGSVLHITKLPGSTVQDALSSASVTLGDLDRTEPTINSSLTRSEENIKVIRVRESFKVEEQTIPFDRQVVRNESLPISQTILVQSGVNGTREITYRIIYEDGNEVSSSVVKSFIIKEAIPEISMMGVQSPFAAIPITGRLAFLNAGNAWIMEGTTGNRRPLVSTGDLDGQIFKLSSDGNWLLFTRKPQKSSDDTINTLWVVGTSEETSKMIDLNVTNIKTYADWMPGNSRTITYSTVESRSTAPGYQANNDLQSVSITEAGIVKPGKELIEANSGGIYGWWGTTFAWSPDGKQLAYARPDSIGLVDLETGTFISKLDLIPLQTHSDWAWAPGINWGPDGKTLFTVSHAPSTGQEADEESPIFDLCAIPLGEGPIIRLVLQSGMFAYPVALPSMDSTGYQVAYLQAIFPDQSDNSRYKIMIIDRDGSNKQVVFPIEGSPGIEPQMIKWSPQESTSINRTIAVIYQNNIWLVDFNSGISSQLTGDGLITNIDWK
jgi:hypothetical protein